MFSNSNNLFDFGALGLVAVLIIIVVYIAIFLIGLWIAYAVIWRAVRRGLTEYHNRNPTVPPV